MSDLLKIGGILIISLFFLATCSQKTRNRGFDLENMDTSVKPGDNFFRYVNGTWLKNTKIPADKSRWGSFIELREDNKKKIRKLMEKARKEAEKPDSKLQKIGDFYATGMDTNKIDAQGYNPIKEELNRIDQIENIDDIQKIIAELHTNSISPLFGFGGSPDMNNSKMIIPWLVQGGLGLPDKDYYLDRKGRAPKIREEYKKHLTKMFKLIDYSDEKAEQAAQDVIEFETRLAQVSMDRAKTRNPQNITHKYPLDKLDKQLSTDYNWDQFFTLVGLDNPDEINVAQPEFFKEISVMVEDLPIDVWRTYLKWNVVNSAANYLSSEFETQNFEFYGKFLHGTEEMSPRWKRVQNTVNAALGEMVGKIYVEKYFPPEAKNRMDRLVKHLKLTYRERLKNLNWMSEETRKKALEKLDSFGVKIGYPEEWRDYSELEIKKDSYFANIKRARKFNFNYELNKINKPKDPKEWHMYPQTVNAYYNPTNNEIVFPAAILQPPFFNVNADAPINYGAIGAVIGHEMTHGFDDQGRKFGPDGNLKLWWTDKDAQRFMKRASVLKKQYDQFTLLDSLHLNTELTLGENIADLGGLTIAYNALQRELAKHSSKTIDGFTPQQRFFLGFAQVWRGKIRDEALANKIQTDPHPPGNLRTNGTVRNLDAFYEAFDIETSDSLYLEESKRAKIW
ncbi:MAG: M13 family metallopeptidase [Candidatus Marinimicrobia bacterium]|nr:M13 family metallopeptidase [Candidatus Neomarinimicrobiota bacterium]